MLKDNTIKEAFCEKYKAYARTSTFPLQVTQNSSACAQDQHTFLNLAQTLCLVSIATASQLENKYSPQPDLFALFQHRISNASTGAMVNSHLNDIMRALQNNPELKALHCKALTKDLPAANLAPSSAQEPSNKVQGNKSAVSTASSAGTTSSN